MGKRTLCIYTVLEKLIERGNKMREEREIRLFEIMDEYGVDMDVAELLLQDEEEDNECKN